MPTKWSVMLYDYYLARPSAGGDISSPGSWYHPVGHFTLTPVFTKGDS